MKPKDFQVEPLGQILEKSLKRLELSGRIEEYGIWPIWDETVGPVVARNAQPEKIRNGTLFVSVTSPTWMNELQYVKDMIADKLNARIGREVVKNIFFVMGRQEAPKLPPGAPPVAEAAPSAESEPREAKLASIRDPETRDLLKRLLETSTRKGRQ
jgi:predicted nucleic acid-binding Zn ribbon protein